jgi:hypothetical protein
MDLENFSIASIEADSMDGLNTAKVEIGAGLRSRSVFFRTRDAVLTPSPESLFCLGLLPSMKLGADFRLGAPLSPRLLGAAARLSDIYCSWHADFSQASLLGAEPAVTLPCPGKAVATFFTGGMDSFYTLLKHRDEITHVIFVHGVDVGLRDLKLRRQVSDMLDRVGQEFGVGVIEIESNIRGFFEYHHIDWEVGHGAALACIGHLLAPHFRRVYIPSSFTYADLFPWGSHPLTDPLWSSEGIEFVHDGNEASRAQKATLLAHSDVALQSLRVCFHNLNSAYNCGYCEKCVRTMINLQAAGALGRCTTFPGKLDLKRVKRLAIMKDSERAFLRENLRALESRPEDRELHEVLLRLLQRPIWLSRLHAQFWRRMRVWRRSIRRRLGLEPRRQWPVLGGDDDGAR